MGMYDDIILRAKQFEHDEYRFQTKDLNQSLSEYAISEEGLFRLTDFDKEGWNHKQLDEPVKIEYTGKLRFYMYDDDTNWIEYWALLDHGKVLWIKRKS